MLTATYTPDSSSSSTCYSATGSNSVTVTTPVKTTPTVTAAAKTTPTFTVTAPSSSITTAQALMVTVAVSGTPIPTGSVTLTGGGYTPAATILSGGSAIISVPAGRLYCDRDGALQARPRQRARSISPCSRASAIHGIDPATDKVQTLPNSARTSEPGASLR